MRLVYVAGKYRDARGTWFVQKNIHAAGDVAQELWLLGFAAICPHLNSAFMHGPDHLFLDGDLAILERCDLMVVLPGWESSAGTRGEIDHAKVHGIPTYYWPEDREVLETIALEPQAHAPATCSITVREAAAVMGRWAAERRYRSKTYRVYPAPLFDDCEVRLSFHSVVMDALTEWAGHLLVESQKEAA